MIKTGEGLVFMLWFRKAESTHRWAQGLLKLCGQGLFILPAIKTSPPLPLLCLSSPRERPQAGRRPALLTWPCLSMDRGQPRLLLSSQNPLRTGSAEQMSPQKEPGVCLILLCEAQCSGKIACNVGGEADWSLWGEQEIRELKTE